MAATKPLYYSVFGALLMCIALLVSHPVLAWERLRDDAPERYDVVRGDTLWDISARYLHSPWQWPELWQANPHIRNPHLIYPGDVLVLGSCQGEPCLSLERGQSVVKLTPQMRTVPEREAIAPLPLDVVRAFLREHRVLEEGEALRELAYVVGGENRRLISGAGDTLYVRGELPDRAQLGIYRQSDPYIANDGTPLGMELIKIGEARQLITEGDIARVEVLSAYQEVRNNDILMPLDQREWGEAFQPRPPLNSVSGNIVAVPGGVRFIGRLQVVAIDLGTQDGLQPGHVLRVDQQGELVNDPRTQELIQLPATEAGQIMIFKPYNRVSYALVMQASNVLAVGDAVRTPVR
ncbi:LysM peptidoglycan-binding domain-containing protein [Halomonas sp. 7T]|uniref:LysM peptidoglycan-binding domain-containing protein n=1 Tax=Halomonas sp. 7T TaxID=2893469 RepID=UPI0021D99B13|nr:LysM domain-containing protein [Halomonas sp. 7T]UXZ54652.1 LysM peptidoglycan-binding domain-containing protein [Halomonas sp. 7T]